MKDKLTYLNTMKMSKAMSALLCQEYCNTVSGATNFNWKKNMCYCQQIGYNTKKHFWSGPVTC